MKWSRQFIFKKQAYSAALNKAENEEKKTYHFAFNAHFDVNQYYFPDDHCHQIHQISEKKNFSPRTKLHRNGLFFESQHYDDLKNHAHVDEFKQVMRVEIATLKMKKTWTEMPYLFITNARTIHITWVFKYKFDDQDFFTKYKARLCAKNDLQKTDVDTYAVILTAQIFRVLMALVCAFDLETRQYNAINAFVNSEINESVYLRSPVDWAGNDVLLFLHRALYGLKQSSTLWYKHFFETLIEFDLNQIFEIECLYINDSMICFFFVNDIAILYDRKFIHQTNEFQKKLFVRYEMRYIDKIEWFLEIKINRDRHHRLLFLCQDFYIDKLSMKFNIDINKKAPGFPLTEDHVKNTKTVIKQEILFYQQRVELINYAIVITRSDVVYAVFKLSKFLTNPSSMHFQAVDRIIFYLMHIKHLDIRFDAQMIDIQSIFLKSSNASYVDDSETRYNSQKYAFMLFKDLVDWRITKQKTVITNNIEVELLIISIIDKEMIWWTRFFDKISFQLSYTSVIQCDNMQTFKILINSTAFYTIKLRHVDVHRHWLGQEVKKKNIAVKWTFTAHILADGFIKALSPQKHKHFVDLIDLTTCHQNDVK